jgi:hypothetical protein
MSTLGLFPPGIDPDGHPRQAIEAHFAGRGNTAAERAMRAHLPTCASCKHLYERSLLLARLDPRGLPAATRLARGLGLRPPPAERVPRWARWLAAGLLMPSVVAASVLLALRLEHGRPRSPPVDPVRDVPAFAARGRVNRSANGTAAGATFWTYRVGPGGSTALVKAVVAAGDELAFAYSNPAGRPYLMVFGVDEHRHVYWFHPAWGVGQPAPSAVRAEPGPGPHELQDAIRHRLDGRKLILYALLSDRRIDAVALEAKVKAAADPTDLGFSAADGVEISQRSLEVLP